MRNSRVLLALAVACTVAGVAWYWPLAALGVVLGAFFGHPAAGVLLGLATDLAYGAPPGLLHALLVPFTLLSLACILIRLAGGSYVRKGFSDTL